MDGDMAAMFPNGIRALIVDDDTKFLKSTTATLAGLNFEVVTCSTVVYALKSLTTGKLKGFDVVLAHAAKAAACGFDFRAIVEADLLLPVIYFLPPDHQAAGDEAEELLRTLEAGAYVIQKPLDADEVRARLWTVIAWRKCHLETKASGGGKRGAAVGFEAAGGLGVEGEDEGRVHYKVVRARAARKRKGGAGSSVPAGGTAVAVAGGHPDKGKEKLDNVANNQQKPAQHKRGRGKKAQKNSGEAFKQLPQPDNGMVNGRQPRQWHPRPSSLFVESVLRTLNMAPYNPNFLSDFAGPSSAAAAAPAPPPPPVYSAPTTPAPPAPPLPVYASAPPAFPPAARQQHQQGPPPPPPPVMQQDMVAPAAAGDGPFTGGMAAGPSAAAATEAGAPSQQHDGDESDTMAMLAELLSNDLDDHYSGGSSLSLAAPDAQILALVSDLNGLIAGGEFGSTIAASSMAPQDLGAAPNGGSSSAASFMAPDQDLGDASAYQCEDNTWFPLDVLLGDLHGPMFEFDGAQLGGSTGGAAAATVARDAAGSSRNGGGEEGGLVEAMFASDQNEDDNSFPMDAPLGDLHGPIFEFDDMDLDAHQLGGSTGGAAADAAAGTSFNGGNEEGGRAEAMLASDQHEDDILDALLGDLHGPIFEFDDVHLDAQLGGSSSTGGGGEEDVIDLNGIDIPFDVWTFEMEDFMPPQHKNRNKNKNSARE